jgi:DNA invertase Pin-like site-specific DNA recombinase
LIYLDFLESNHAQISVEDRGYPPLGLEISHAIWLVAKAYRSVYTLNGPLLYSPGMSKLLGYIRVSTDKQVQSGAGLDSQVLFLEAEARRRGLDLEIIQEVEAMSGKSYIKRTALNQAMDRLDKGQASGLAVAKLDRLSRSVADFLAILERSRKGKWSLIIGDLSLDTSTPLGEAMATISATFAQLERKRIGERTKEALKVKKAEGKVLGRPRLLDNTLRLQILDGHARGNSLNLIAKTLNSNGYHSATGGKFYASTIKAIVDSVA